MNSYQAVTLFSVHILFAKFFFLVLRSDLLALRSSTSALFSGITLSGIWGMQGLDLGLHLCMLSLHSAC